MGGTRAAGARRVAALAATACRSLRRPARPPEPRCCGVLVARVALLCLRVLAPPSRSPPPARLSLCRCAPSVRGRHAAARLAESASRRRWPRRWLFAAALGASAMLGISYWTDLPPALLLTHTARFARAAYTVLRPTGSCLARLPACRAPALAWTTGGHCVVTAKIPRSSLGSICAVQTCAIRLFVYADHSHSDC